MLDEEPASLDVVGVELDPIDGRAFLADEGDPLRLFKLQVTSDIVVSESSMWFKDARVGLELSRGEERCELELTLTSRSSLRPSSWRPLRVHRAWLTAYPSYPMPLLLPLPAPWML